MKNNYKALAKNIGMELLGSVFIAVGIYNFAVASHFPERRVNNIERITAFFRKAHRLAGQMTSHKWAFRGVTETSVSGDLHCFQLQIESLK